MEYDQYRNKPKGQSKRYLAIKKKCRNGINP